MEVRMTKDGQIIVCYDEDLLRLCGDTRKVSDVEFKDLPKFLKKMPMHFSKFGKQAGKDEASLDTTFETYDRKAGDQDCFSLLEDVFKAIPKVVPISLEVKDKDSIEACTKVVDLIKKYERFSTTVIGGEDDYVNERFLQMDERVCLSCTKQDVLKIVLFYFTGLLPFLAINRDCFQMVYMTRDFIKMKYEERKVAKSFRQKCFLTGFIYLGQLFNMFAGSAFKHLQDRGIFTVYWVLNEESETACAL